MALLLATVRPVPVVAAEPFAFRGVIQGFYGTPWSNDAVVDAVRWLGANGLNTYVHAPKFDPYQRSNWRDPYPSEQMDAFRAQIAAAAEAGVRWVPNLSPGFPLIPGPPAPGVPSVDVCFSCGSDLEAIVAKLDPFVEAGVRTVMLSFDDVQKISSHPEDAIVYGAGDEAYGAMNRDLLNALYDHYAARVPGFRVLTVLADYSGTAETPYLRGVRGLRDGIDVMWTGTAVVSRTIATADAAAYAAAAGVTKVLVWDNYPVHDYVGGIFDKPTRLFLGPYSGRAPDLADAVSGVLANPMGLPVLSRVALGTMSAYLADPSGYDPESTWRDAIDDLATPGLVLLAENSRSSTLDRTESAPFVAARDAFLEAFAGAFWTDAADVLSAELRREADASTTILDAGGPVREEAAPWLLTLRTNARAGLAALDVVRTTRPSLYAQADRTQSGVVRIYGRVTRTNPNMLPNRLADLTALHTQSLAGWEVVHGDRLSHDLATLYANENRMDAFVAEARRTAAAWLPVSGLAASSIAVTVDGTPVATDGQGGFAVELAGDHPAVEVVATDGAGGRTGLIV